MGNCATAESSIAQQREHVSRAHATHKTNVILYDEVTGEEYRVEVANQKDTVWSTVNAECTKRDRRVRKITFGGSEIFETQTWEQLGIADDATVIVETENTREACQCYTVQS